MKRMSFLSALILLFATAAFPDAPSTPTRSDLRSAASVNALDAGDNLLLNWQGDEAIEISISKSQGVFKAPIKVKIGDREIGFDGFYVHINKLQEGFAVESTHCALRGDRIRVEHVLRHPALAASTTTESSTNHDSVRMVFTLWMEPQDRAIRVEVETDGEGQHLDRLGLGDHHTVCRGLTNYGAGLDAERMFFGRMYVFDRPQAFEVEHNYNTCRFWCWKMANGLTELQATEGPAKGFRFDPDAGRYDLYTYCESPIRYLLFFTAHGPQETIAEYRNTIAAPPPPTLAQLPGRVGVMTAYSIAERYEDFMEEWGGRGARDFVWLSYCPTPGDRQRVEKYGGLYATYDLYLDFFSEGPRKADGWSPEMVQYRDNGKMVRGYWSSSWLLPDLYVKMATTRVMGVFGRKFRNDNTVCQATTNCGENDFVATPATRYSNLAITRAEVGPSGLYLDVHASKAPHHYFDYEHRHHGAPEQMRGEKALFDFARQYLGNVPVWSEGGGEDYVGLMDGGWFMDWRPPEELGIHAAKWEYYPFIDQVHRERLLNMGIYYPLDHYDLDMVNAAILFGRPQAVSVYYGTLQDDIGGRLQVYYMTKAFHRMLGLSRMDRVDFADDDIHRCMVSYSNGARAWVNRSTVCQATTNCDANWEIEGYCLPPMGYLVKGPGGFIEYRAKKNGETVDVVRSDEYDFFSCPKRMDFGPIVADGALAVVHNPPDRLVLYEVQKPKAEVEIVLGKLRGTQKGQKASRAWAVLTRDRKVELGFPDLRQPADPLCPGGLGNNVQFRPVEMRETLRYEVELTEPAPSAQ